MASFCESEAHDIIPAISPEKSGKNTFVKSAEIISLVRGHQQKTFIMVSRFCPLRG